MQLRMPRNYAFKQNYLLIGVTLWTRTPEVRDRPSSEAAVSAELHCKPSCTSNAASVGQLPDHMVLDSSFFMLANLPSKSS